MLEEERRGATRIKTSARPSQRPYLLIFPQKIKFITTEPLTITNYFVCRIKVRLKKKAGIKRDILPLRRGYDLK